MPCRWMRSTGQRCERRRDRRPVRRPGAAPAPPRRASPPSRGTGDERARRRAEPSQATTIERWPAATSARSSARQNLLGAADRVGADRRQRIGDAEDRSASRRHAPARARASAASTRATPARAGHAPVVALVEQLAAVRQASRSRMPARGGSAPSRRSKSASISAWLRWAASICRFSRAVAVAERERPSRGGRRRREALHAPSLRRRRGRRASR